MKNKLISVTVLLILFCIFVTISAGETAEEWNNIGVYLIGQGKYKEAMDAFNKSIELNQNLVPALFNRGRLYGNLGQYGKAIEDFNKVIELNPNDSDAYRYRGAAYSVIGQHKEAIEDLNKAIELNPNDVRAYLARALVYYNLKEFEKTINDCDKVIEIASPGSEICNEAIAYRESAAALLAQTSTPTPTPMPSSTPTPSPSPTHVISPTPTPMPTPEEGVPGFEHAFAIVGLLVVAYLLRRRK